MRAEKRSREEKMEYKKKIIKVVDRFYVECIEEFKEAELKIANDSKFRTLFRKKDYDGNTELLRTCKDRARSLKFPLSEIPKDDQASRELIRHTELCIRQFNRLCDSYIQMQLALKKKAEGGQMPYKEYKSIYGKSQEDNAAMNKELKELDLLYTDYIEDEDYDVYEFL